MISLSASLAAVIALLSPGAYAELVEQYHDGAFERSVESLRVEQAPAVLQATKDYEPSTESFRKAAILLHTETAIRVVEKEGVHLEAAERYLEDVEDASFVRAWRLLMGRHFQRLMRPWNAIHHLEAALVLFPEDTELEMHAGMAYELAAWIGSEKMVGRAEETFRRVLEREPDHAEAHLRLGRVLEMAGDPAGAVAALEKSLALTDAASVRLPANLLLGDIFEGRGDLGRAIRFFEDAAAADPYCQPAAVALAHALHRSRNTVRAREVMRAFLARTSSTSEPDGWWRYLRGDVRRVDSLLHELRDEVRP